MIMNLMKPGNGRGKNETEDEEVWVMEEEEGARRLIRIEHKLFVPWLAPRCQQASPPHNLTHQMMMSAVISYDQHRQFSSHCPIIVAVFPTLPLPWLKLPEGWDGQGSLPMAIMATEDGHRRPSPSSMAASRWNPLNSWEGQLSYSCSSVLVLSMTLINSLKRPRPLAVQVLMTI